MSTGRGVFAGWAERGEDARKKRHSHLHFIRWEQGLEGEMVPASQEELKGWAPLKSSRWC